MLQRRAGMDESAKDALSHMLEVTDNLAATKTATISSSKRQLTSTHVASKRRKKCKKTRVQSRRGGLSAAKARTTPKENTHYLWPWSTAMYLDDITHDRLSLWRPMLLLKYMRGEKSYDRPDWCRVVPARTQPCVLRKMLQETLGASEALIMPAAVKDELEDLRHLVNFAENHPRVPRACKYYQGARAQREDERLFDEYVRELLVTVNRVCAARDFPPVQMFWCFRKGNVMTSNYISGKREHMRWSDKLMMQAKCEFYTKYHREPTVRDGTDSVRVSYLDALHQDAEVVIDERTLVQWGSWTVVGRDKKLQPSDMARRKRVCILNANDCPRMRRKSYELVEGVAREHGMAQHPVNLLPKWLEVLSQPTVKEDLRGSSFFYWPCDPMRVRWAQRIPSEKVQRQRDGSEYRMWKEDQQHKMGGKVESKEAWLKKPEKTRAEELAILHYGKEKALGERYVGMAMEDTWRASWLALEEDEREKYRYRYIRQLTSLFELGAMLYEHLIHPMLEETPMSEGTLRLLKDYLAAWKTLDNSVRTDSRVNSFTRWACTTSKNGVPTGTWARLTLGTTGGGGLSTIESMINAQEAARATSSS